MVVVLLGAPGVGKGTQAVRLVEEVGGVHVSTGDLLRAARRDGTELGRRAQRYMDAGELVPDRLILELVREHLADLPPEATVILDGFPRTIAQATGLEETLAGLGRGVDVVVLFEAPEEVLVRRLSGRRSCPACGAVYNVYYTPPASEGVCDRCGGTLVHRSDDEPETVRRRLQVYHEQTSPLIDYYRAHDARLETLGADRDVEDVFAEFRDVVGAGKV